MSGKFAALGFTELHVNFTLLSTSFESCMFNSSVGVVAVIYVVVLIIAQYYTGNYVAGPIKTAPDEWTDVFLVVPVICFAYQVRIRKWN